MLNRHQRILITVNHILILGNASIVAFMRKYIFMLNGHSTILITIKHINTDFQNTRSPTRRVPTIAKRNTRSSTPRVPAKAAGDKCLPMLSILCLFEQQFYNSNVIQIMNYKT